MADICEHPFNDAPQLIYADWLDSNGEPEELAARACPSRKCVAMIKASLPPLMWPEEVRQ